MSQEDARPHPYPDGKPWLPFDAGYDPAKSET